jgi:KDO2-lipid IV(A) lauroyltransferase
MGSLLVTLHLGDWEAGSSILPWIGFDPLYVVAKPPRNRPLSLHLQRLRESRGLRVLPRRGAMKHASAILSAGGSLAMLLDQRARMRPAMAPFFGRMAACDRSAGVLVRRAKVPVMVGAIYRADRPYRWRVVVPRVLWPEELAGRSPEDVAALLNVEFEKLIRAAPEQYFWLHDRYRGISAQAEAAADDDSDGD